MENDFRGEIEAGKPAAEVGGGNSLGEKWCVPGSREMNEYTVHFGARVNILTDGWKVGVQGKRS